MKSILVTGGAGFIGGSFVRHAIDRGDVHVVNLDALTYAGNLDSIPSPDHPRHTFVRGDIADKDLVAGLLDQHHVETVFHFAAESHVDRSIDGPGAFIQTNVVGTYCLLDASLQYYRQLSGKDRDRFRFLHVSTDEVYGSLGDTGLFSESTPYDPHSPYSASKASSDHLVRAWHHTFGLPTMVTNCSNNYGPYQFPEKLIPLVTLNAIAGKPLPVYGDGSNVRDWLYVDDHCAALQRVADDGRIGQTYNVGGDNEQTNLSVVQTICDVVDQLCDPLAKPRRELIEFVTDRPGHDQRYAIDATKIKSELGWQPATNFVDGLRKTIQWYLSNDQWIGRIRDGKYQGQRLGMAK